MGARRSETRQASSCTAALSGIDPDHFRLIVDGRPGQPVGGVFGDKRAQAGGVTDFELMWEIPRDAQELELEVTGSTGDVATAILAVGEMPLVYGEE